MNMSISKSLITISISLLFLASSGLSQEYIIKFATLAPEGSTWMNVMREYDKAIRAESGGKLGFRIYPGGVQGEDKDVIRKMRLGQLHSAGLTGVGLGEIAPQVRLLDSPFLFQNYDEVDHVYETFNSEFDRAFQENNFVLLGWAEVGFVYVFSNTPVRSVEDMNGVKMWMWEGDPVAEATFRSFGINPIPLSVVDVLTSLQTGLINGAYISPYAAIALQWNTRVKYMLNVPLADAAGAVVIAKKKFDTLPPDLQQVLLRNGKKFLRELTRKSREQNEAALVTLKKEGITTTQPASENAVQEYREAGKRARQMLAGRLYSQEFLDRVEKSVMDFRKKHSGSK
ncbi:MAG: TRAP transporter substrate-binding protein DctP [Ignavibacteria bacterium]|nr:TRAP transporter substrate-binding protein DctP [Ignavibacteria bacterium]